MIDLIADNGQKHRIERLTKVMLVAREMMGLSEEQATRLIKSATDTRGTLTVHWYAYPTPSQCAAFSTAWKLVGESPDRALHALAVQE
jgi:hypothetical protein